MKISVCLECIFIDMSLMLILFVGTAHAEMASVYGGRDGYCGSRTANGERVNCSAMTAAHRRLPFGEEAEAIIAALMAAAAAGAVSHVTNVRAWTGAEFKSVAERASKAASAYRPPGKKR